MPNWLCAALAMPIDCIKAARGVRAQEHVCLLLTSKRVCHVHMHLIR